MVSLKKISSVIFCTAFLFSSISWSNQWQCSQILLADKVDFEKKREFNEAYYNSFREHLNSLDKEKVLEQLARVSNNEASPFAFERMIAIADFYSKNNFYERIRPIFSKLSLTEVFPKTGRVIKFSGTSKFFIKVEEVQKNTNPKIGRFKKELKVPTGFYGNETEMAIYMFKLMVSLIKLTLSNSSLPRANKWTGQKGQFTAQEYSLVQSDLMTSAYEDIFSVVNELAPDSSSEIFEYEKDPLDQSSFWNYLHAILPWNTTNTTEWLRPNSKDFSDALEDPQNHGNQIEERYKKTLKLHRRATWVKRYLYIMMAAPAIWALAQADIVEGIKKIGSLPSEMSELFEIIKIPEEVHITQQSLTEAQLMIIGFYEKDIEDIENDKSLSNEEKQIQTSGFKNKISALRANLPSDEN